jgi:hypothetical protein
MTLSVKELKEPKDVFERISEPEPDWKVDEIKFGGWHDVIRSFDVERLYISTHHQRETTCSNLPARSLYLDIDESCPRVFQAHTGIHARSQEKVEKEIKLRIETNDLVCGCSNTCATQQLSFLFARGFDTSPKHKRNNNGKMITRHSTTRDKIGKCVNFIFVRDRCHFVPFSDRETKGRFVGLALIRIPNVINQLTCMKSDFLWLYTELERKMHTRG